MHLEPILVEDLWLVGGPGAFPPQLQEVPLAELGRFPVALTSSAQSHLRLVEGMALSQCLRLQILAEVDLLAVQKALVREGTAFTILAHSAFHAELAEGRVSAARIASPTISRHVAMASAAGRSVRQACHALGALMGQVARDLVTRQVWRGRAEVGGIPHH